MQMMTRLEEAHALDPVSDKLQAAVQAVAKPQRRAIEAIVAFSRSSSCSASRTRCSRTQVAGAAPVASVKRRMKVRVDMAARTARAFTERSWAR